MPETPPTDAPIAAAAPARTAPVAITAPDGGSQEGVLTLPDGWGAAPPLVSCTMISRGRIFPAALAIECYRRQTYPNRELVIVTAATDGALAAHVAALGDPTIRIDSVAEMPLGELRNAAVARSRGGILCTWDDDDLSDPQRIAFAVAALAPARAAASLLLRTLLWWPARGRLAITRRYGWEMTLAARRAALPIFPAIGPGEDTTVVNLMRGLHPLVLIDRPIDYLRVVGTNICPVDHFEWLFDTATETFADEAYEATLATLDRRMPVAAYRAGL
ncbi:glycosyltransferase family A protein [Sphingomonas profundi]|uniref:glycosyltransferase family A protein n=1 Tax=Alterirhizorhabdus profundi TaxID=2681549 RepID=UPI0012E7EBB0|nr:glycosyltransferase family A protein [Sphingomonas profundi]